MAETFQIKNGRGKELSLTWKDTDHYTVAIMGDGVEAKVSVYAYLPNSGQIDAFWADVANEWGWKGEKSWESLEGEIHITGAHDGKGHVHCQVDLRPDLNPESWSLTFHIEIEAGEQLSRVARDAKDFMDARPS